MRYVVSVMLLIVAVIHLLPVSGALGAEQLASLYGIAVSDPSLVVLMRHRAVLFGLLGALFVFAAFRPALQGLAFIAGFVSVGTFLLFALQTGAYNEQVGRVFAADLVAAVALLVGVAAYAYQRRRA